MENQCERAFKSSLRTFVHDRVTDTGYGKGGAEEGWEGEELEISVLSEERNTVQFQ